MEGILRSKKNFRAFHIPAQSLVLDGITLRNLEIFTNNTDGGVRGSLFAVVDHACTPFGRRLLRRWISNPLVCKAKIERRLDAVTELVDGWKSDFVKATRKGLAGCPDIENGLTIVALGKATPSKFVRTVAQLDKLRRLFLKYRDDVSLKFNTSSVLLVDIFEQVSSFLSDSRLEDALLRLNRTEAERDNKAALFNVSLENRDAYADVFCAKDEIASLEVELEGYRTSRLPKLLGKFTVEYKCVSGLEYLVEVKNKELGGVPSDWIKITATKQVTRFRPPLVDVTFKKLCRAREKLTLASNDAWTHFLKEFSDQHYESCKCAVEHISSFDCLMSLAVVAKQPGYCRPRFTEGKCIYIKDGRHPVIEGLLTNGEQYVANDTSLDHKRKVGVNLFGILIHFVIIEDRINFPLISKSTKIYEIKPLTENPVFHQRKGGFPLALGEFFRANRKACFDSFVLLKCCSTIWNWHVLNKKDKDTLFASREKRRVVEIRLKFQAGEGFYASHWFQIMWCFWSVNGTAYNNFVWITSKIHSGWEIFVLPFTRILAALTKLWVSIENRMGTQIRV